MPIKPIFVATHPRACSTAFERVFMTRRETLQCLHEPFGDAFYFGPERLGSRYEEDEKARIDSGFDNACFGSTFDRIDREGTEGKRLFIKDMAHYFLPPNGQPASIAPSLQIKKRGIGTIAYEMGGVNGVNGYNESRKRAPYPYPTQPEPNNPTVVPAEILSRFHFAFLIRDPHSSVPSYFRCTIPPLDKVTGFYEYFPNEAGYVEIRRLFEYLRHLGLVGPANANGDATAINGSKANGVQNGKADICVVDADDMLDNPSGIIENFCKSVGLKYEPEMLSWNSDEDHKYAREAFEKWRGFHDDAIGSTELKPRTHKKKAKSEAAWDAEWKEKYGDEAAGIIRGTVDKNMGDYLYMKQFAIRA